MIIVVCLDDRNGMLFNHRRQSRDRQLTADLLHLREGHSLWMNRYSAALFEGAEIQVDEAFLEKAAPGDYCFIETMSPTEDTDRIEGVVLYRWNRVYPSDMRFDLDLSGFRLTECTEFPGSSHEKITREIYSRPTD